jgi:phosphatidate cytidylyltransferase
MILKRIVTGFAVAVLIGLLIWAGDPWFTIAACIVSALATYEFYKIARHESIYPFTYPGIIFSILFILQAHLSWPLACPALISLLILTPLIWILFKHDKDKAFINAGWTIMGVLYIGWFLSFYISMRNMLNGMGWVYLVIACTAFSDVFAYAVGSKVGKHQLASSISPGKTIEGAMGGMSASIFFAFIVSMIFKLPLNWWQIICVGFIIGIFAQLGDLTESLLKRNMKTKDAGNILPGHGGILDRIDSHLLVAPVAYFLILMVTNQS